MLICVADRLFQLTWLSGKTYYYDVNDFNNISTQTTPLSDGWGATTDGRHLIISDGSSTLTFLDPDTIMKVKSIVVTDNGSAVPMLNEVGQCHPEAQLLDFTVLLHSDQYIIYFTSYMSAGSYHTPALQAHGLIASTVFFVCSWSTLTKRSGLMCG